MNDSTAKPVLPREQINILANPKLVDLAKPDEEAAALAEQLQKMPMNVLFGKAALFTCKWILRPIFWWPIKYYFILVGKVLRGYVMSKSEIEAEKRRWDDIQRDWDEQSRRRERGGTW